MLNQQQIEALSCTVIPLYGTFLAPTRTSEATSAIVVVRWLPIIELFLCLVYVGEQLGAGVSYH